jgi:hypothetical protein
MDAVFTNTPEYTPNRLWLNDGSGYFFDSNLRLGFDKSQAIALGDLDGDGSLDGFVANNGPNKVYINRGDATSDNGQLLGSADSRGVALGDLDGDGDLDAFVANYDGPCKVWINQTLSTEEGEKQAEIAFKEPLIVQPTITLKNYPDPFSYLTTVEFSVPQTDRVTLQVMNAMGESVEVLYDRIAEKGKTYRIQFTGDYLPAGVYILRLQQLGNAVAEKMVLMR